MAEAGGRSIAAPEPLRAQAAMEPPAARALELIAALAPARVALPESPPMLLPVAMPLPQPRAGDK